MEIPQSPHHHESQQAETENGSTPFLFMPGSVGCSGELVRNAGYNAFPIDGEAQ
jgi:hypothetical protein